MISQIDTLNSLFFKQLPYYLLKLNFLISDSDYSMVQFFHSDVEGNELILELKDTAANGDRGHSFGP